MTETLLLKNACILDVDAGATGGRTNVLVSGGVIASVNAGAGPSGARVIDLEGRTLMPGLIDCHLHVCADSMTAYPTQFPALAVARAAKIMRETLLRGFTTVRDAGGADAGYRQAVELGLLQGPRMFVSGRPISATGGHGDHRNIADFAPRDRLTSESTMMVIADGVPEVRRAVREELRRGADQIKLLASGGISSPGDPLDHDQFAVDEIEAAVSEATRAGRYAFAHAYMPSAITRCVEAGVRTIEHGSFIDEASAKLMAERGAYLVPTLVVYKRVVQHAKEIGISAFHLEKATEVLAAGTRCLEIAARAGVKIAIGTDLFRAPKEYQSEEFLIRNEVQKAADIIRSATIVGAEVVRMEGRIGRVSEGYLADLIAIDGDPLQDLGLLQDQGLHLPLIVKQGAVVKNSLSGEGAGR
jgi:imidazolonepropionase-like amidohydrolase